MKTKIILVIFLSLVGGIFNRAQLQAQTVTVYGPSTAIVGDVDLYSINPINDNLIFWMWDVMGGTKQNMTITSVQATWTMSGTNVVMYNAEGFYNYYYGENIVTVSSSSAPSTPPNPIILSNCGSVVLQRSGTPPTGITWYWQSSASGTSTTNSSSTITLSSGSIYYIRARDNNSGMWSTNSGSVSYSIQEPITWYQDQDGDGLGDPANTLSTCTQPSGYIDNSDDQCPTQSGSAANSGCPENALSDENYIYTIAPTKPTTDLSTLASADKIETVTYFDGLGRPMQNVGIRAGGDKSKNNLVNWRDEWIAGTTGSTPFFNRVGVIEENTRVIAEDPYGVQSVLWEGNAAYDGSGMDGGWESDLFAIDNTKAYIYTVWFKAVGGQSGRVYHGMRNVNNLDGTPNTNPYFRHQLISSLNLDQWYLMVGVIHPPEYTGSGSGLTGFYDRNGNKILSGTEFKWTSDPMQEYKFRSFMWSYSNTPEPNEKIFFYNPMFQMLDGNEQTIGEMCESKILNDIITHVGYDDRGRQAREYLPYASINNIGSYRVDALSATGTFYNTDKYENTANPYSEKRYENSPLDRVLEQSAPGASWLLDMDNDTDHTIKFDYQTNGSNEVRRYEVSLTIDTYSSGTGVVLTYVPTLVLNTAINNGNYVTGELYKTVTRDENWQPGQIYSKEHTTEEFKDKQGRIILKRTYGPADLNGDGDYADGGEASATFDTYYVYDKYGNLTYVLPPKSEPHSAKPDATKLKELCYQYKYDQWNRLVEKKIPGKGDDTNWEEIVYNKLDQPIMTRDPNLKVNGQWLVTKYDVFGRVAYAGIRNSTSSRKTFQSYANSTTAPLFETRTTSSLDYMDTYYTSVMMPTVLTEIMMVNYYDDYEFALPTGLSTTVNTSYGVTSTANTQGLITGSKVKVLDTGNWITTVNYYDNKGRIIYVYSKNDYFGTIDIVENDLDDFNGRLLATKTTHQRTNKADIVTVDSFEYDHMGRVTKQTQTVTGNGTPEVIVTNTYDELGQLITKGVGGNTTQTRLQTVDYAYNIRRWLKKINHDTNNDNDLFDFTIMYEDNDASGKLYNGNISQTLWNTLSVNNTNNPKSTTYNYNYDPLNRITSAMDNSGNYNLSSVIYDKNGNIMALARNGHTNSDATTFGIMDDLLYTYTSDSNKLQKVQDNGADYYGFKDGTDETTEFTYDANGNLTIDLNKNISNIEYNYLNLPERISIDYDAEGYIEYVYNAMGEKMSKKVYSVDNNYMPMITDYDGIYIYENNDLQFFNTAEGYASPVDVNNYNSGFNYIYQYKDHLGNIRLSYSDTNGDGEITSGSSSVFYDDMESSNGWDSVGALYGESATMDSEHTISGNNAAKLTLVGSGDLYAHSNDWIQINNSTPKDYIFSGWIYVESPNDIYARILLFMNENDETGYFTSIGDPGKVRIKDQWVYMEKRVTVPTNIDKLNLRIEVYTSYSGGAIAWFDDLSIREVDDVNYAEIIEENNYYPFGLRHKGYNKVVNGLENNYLTYNGKEWNESLGFNIYEMDMRQYDPAIARWTSIDPITHWSMSTYTAFDNNPIYWADPSGASPIYNSTTRQYVINGEVVPFEAALKYAQNGGNADGSNNNTPDEDYVINSSEAELKSIANDLNSIYQKKYGESPFSVEKQTRKRKVKDGFWPWSDDEYEEVEVYVLKGSVAFDWERDKYTAMLYQIITSPEDINVDIIEDNGKLYKSLIRTTINGLLADYGGGYTIDANNIVLSSSLSLQGEKPGEWTLGGLTLHELLRHISPDSDPNEGVNVLRRFYGLRTGKEHGVGNRRNFQIKRIKR